MADVSRLVDGLVAIVRGVTQRLDFMASYRARVVSQNADLSLELIPDDARLPRMSRVPLRLGIPGIDIKVSPGAYVLVGFEGGSPESPRAELWESASVTELVLTTTAKVTINSPVVNLGDESGQPLARVGDIVRAVIGPATPVTGTVSGQPFVGLLTVVTPVYGVIESGATKTRAS